MSVVGMRSCSFFFFFRVLEHTRKETMPSELKPDSFLKIGQKFYISTLNFHTNIQLPIYTDIQNCKEHMFNTEIGIVHLKQLIIVKFVKYIKNIAIENSNCNMLIYCTVLKKNIYIYKLRSMLFYHRIVAEKCGR